MPVFAKTATYGLIHIVIAFCVAWAVSGDIRIAIGISLVEPFIQIIGFFFHEKAWARFGAKTDRQSWHIASPPCCAATADMIRQHLASGACNTTKGKPGA